MLKRLFRLALILIILLGISKYTTILDNTKIKPYLARVETIIEENTESIRGWFSKDNEETIINEPEITGTIDYGITGSANFGNEDMIDGTELPVKIAEVTGKNEDVLVVDQDSNNANNTGVKKIANLQIKNCVSPRGKFVPKNGYIIAYEARSSSECKREKRTCNNGKLEGSYIYDTCFYSSTINKQQTSSSLSKEELQAMKKEYGLIEEVKNTNIDQVNNNELTNGLEAGPGVVVDSTQTKEAIIAKNTNGINYNTDANLLKNSVNDPEKHYLGNNEKSIAVLENQQTELNNHKLKTRSLKRQVQGYKGEVFISDYKELTAKNSYFGKACNTPRGSIISNGQFVTARKTSSAENDICEMETRFCIDGKLQGSFSSESCKGKYPEIINNAPGLDVTNNAIAVGYTETRNVMKNNLIDLDYMPTSLQESSISSYEVYHQPDSVDSNGSPSFQFIPIDNNGVFTDSQIILNPEYEIYHQPDER